MTAAVDPDTAAPDNTAFCPACSSAIDGFAPGPGGRPAARCPRCQALERHRFLAMMFAAFDAELRIARRVLDVAPAAVVERLIRQRVPGLYVGIDLDPAADDRNVNVVADLCGTPFATDSFDVAVCFHVFEHIPDDGAAMREVARVLKPDGVGFVQVPWRRSSPTDEDWNTTPEERIRRFGQADHIRWYGSDFEDRLLANGLDAARVWPADILPEELRSSMGIPNRTPIWIVNPARGPVGELADEEQARALHNRLTPVVIEGWRSSVASTRQMQAQHHEEFEALQAAADGAQQEAQHWERSYQQLRSRWPVRAMAALRNLFTRGR